MNGLGFQGLFALAAQVSAVLLVAANCRRDVPARLLVLICSAFVTVPLFTYRPLDDVGMVFAFDIVVPLLLLTTILRGEWRFRVEGLKGAALLIAGLPVIFAPLGLLIVDDRFAPFHAVLTSLVIYRTLVIVIAMVLLATWMRGVSLRAVTRLFAVQFLVLFGLGAAQYLVGVDFVVYERIKDTENILQALSGSDEVVRFGVGFMGLFRGAVSQMAVIAVFWWFLWTSLDPRGRVQLGHVVVLSLTLVCVVASLSRIGIGALAVVLAYSMLLSQSSRRFAVSGVLVAVVVLVARPDILELAVASLDFVGDRFSYEQLTGAVGSGSTRVDSAVALADDMGEDWRTLLFGTGGYNTITAEQRYGVFGMHGDFLDALARYGLILGAFYLVGFGLIALRELRGFMSPDRQRHVYPRAFALLALGVACLALTQGALMFAGAAGYLAAAQAWLAFAFCVVARHRYYRGNDA